MSKQYVLKSSDGYFFSTNQNSSALMASFYPLTLSEAKECADRGIAIYRLVRVNKKGRERRKP